MGRAEAERTALPSGTVTLLFSDIEGSTRLLQDTGALYATILAQQREVMTAAFAAHAGRVVDTEGDAFFVAFARARDAVEAAIDAQRRLAARTWPHGGDLRVRIGLHTGEPEALGTGYVGLDVHRAARLGAVAHGGQVLLSQTTRDLVAGQLPEGVALRDLGAHRLKDLREPERVHELVIEGLTIEAPQLASVDARPNNLPTQRGTLLGRARELEQAIEILRRPDLTVLTIIGPGGTGKTRFALQLAADTIEQHRDGAFFVDLAPLSDAALVPSAVASGLRLRNEAGRPALDAVRDHLRRRQMLLVLDNFEQLIAASTFVSELAASCPGLRIVVTSRAPLRVTGEHQLPLEPLAQAAAVQLFLERGRAVRPDLSSGGDGEAVVAEICRRVDRLPLAIELAAARVRHLPLPALASRLERRLPVLAGGARDAPARQRTLRDTIAWSYDLLPADQQHLFRVLGAFSGGTTIEAATAVADLPDALDGLAELIDASLVRRDEETTEPRYTMLETIREYAVEQLDASTDAEETRRRHLTYFLAFAEAADAEVRGPSQAEWLARLEREHDNMRAALGHAFEAGRVLDALRLVAALGWFWRVHDHFAEGGRWLAKALAAAPKAADGLRARALVAAGLLEFAQERHVAAAKLLTEGAAAARRVGDASTEGWALHGIGRTSTRLGDFPGARAALEESISRHRSAGDEHGAAYSLYFQGIVARRTGDLARAASLIEESLRPMRAAGDDWGTAWALLNLAAVERERGDAARAMVLVRESMDLCERIHTTWGISSCLELLGMLAVDSGDRGRAAVLLGAGVTMQEEIGRPLEHRAPEEWRGLATDPATREAWERGRAMRARDAVAFARQAGDRSPGLAGRVSGDLA